MGAVGRGAALLLGSRAAGVAMGVGVFILLSRGLTPARFGVLTTALSITQMATTPFDSSLGTMHTREAVRRPELEADILRWSGLLRLVVGSVLALALALAAPALVGTENVTVLVIVLAVLPVGWLFAANPVLVRQRALAAMATLGLVQGGIWLAAVAVLTLTEAPLALYGVAYVMSIALQGLTVRLLAGRLRHRGAAEQLRLPAFLALMRPGLGLAVVAVAVAVYLKIDAVILLHLRGPAEAGAYALAFRVLEQATIVPVTLHNVFGPRIFRARPGTPELARAFDEYVRVVLLASAPLVVLGVIVSEPFVRILFGERYLAAVPLLRMVLPGFVLMCLGYAMTAVAVSAGRTRRQVATALTALVANVSLNLLLVPAHGAKAAAVVTVLTEVVVVLGLYRTVRTVPGVHFPWRWSGRLAAALGGAGATALAAPSPVVGAVCFAATYAVLAVVAGLVSGRELRAGRLSLGLVGG